MGRGLFGRSPSDAAGRFRSSSTGSVSRAGLNVAGGVSMQTVKRTVEVPLVTPKPQVKSEIPSLPKPESVVVPEKKSEPVESSPAPQVVANPHRLSP